MATYPLPLVEEAFNVLEEYYKDKSISSRFGIKKYGKELDAIGFIKRAIAKLKARGASNVSKGTIASETQKIIFDMSPKGAFGAPVRAARNAKVTEMLNSAQETLEKAEKTGEVKIDPEKKKIYLKLKTRAKKRREAEEAGEPIDEEMDMEDEMREGEEVDEKKILGMKPLTFGIVAVGVVAVGFFVAIMIKRAKKK